MGISIVPSFTASEQMYYLNFVDPFPKSDLIFL